MKGIMDTLIIIGGIAILITLAALWRSIHKQTQRADRAEAELAAIMQSIAVLASADQGTWSGEGAE